MTYRTIVVDPPWPIEWHGGLTKKNGRGKRYPDNGTVKRLPYPTMAVTEIAALPVLDFACADGAHLYLWIPDELLLQGVGPEVVEAWGFTPLKKLLIWKKPAFAMGRFPRPQHEAVVLGRLGSLPFAVADTGSVQTWKQTWEGNRKHSAKPEGFFDLVERASPGPYLELFSRRVRLGWDYRWHDGDIAGASSSTDASPDWWLAERERCLRCGHFPDMSDCGCACHSHTEDSA